MKRDEEKICGRHACRAVFARRAKDILRVFITEPCTRDFGPELKACARARKPYRIVGADEMAAITESHHHEGVCVVARPRPQRALQGIVASSGPGVVLALSDVGNPHNVGALLRTAAHFGARAAILGGTARRLSAAAHRTAEGAAEWLDIVFAEQLERALHTCRRAGYAVCATSSHDGQSLYGPALPRKMVLLLGAERTGLSKGLLASADVRIRIPGTGHVESLNVSTAAAVILAESWRQRSA